MPMEMDEKDEKVPEPDDYTAHSVTGLRVFDVWCEMRVIWSAVLVGRSNGKQSDLVSLSLPQTHALTVKMV